jgi:DNA-binding XRE family transcriptional regulator
MDKTEFKSLRIAAGWNVQACADNLGLKQSSVHKIERGDSPVSAPIEKLMRILSAKASKKRNGVISLAGRPCKGSRSISQHAAEWANENGVTGSDAARKFGVSAGVVNRMRAKLRG